MVYFFFKLFKSLRILKARRVEKSPVICGLENWTTVSLEESLGWNDNLAHLRFTNLERAYPFTFSLPAEKETIHLAVQRRGLAKIVPPLKINKYRRTVGCGSVGGKEKRKRIKEERKEREGRGYDALDGYKWAPI